MNTGGPRIRKHAFNRPLARQTPKSGAAARRAVSLHLAEKQVSLTKFNPAKSKVLSFLRFMIFHVGQLQCYQCLARFNVLTYHYNTADKT